MTGFRCGVVGRVVLVSLLLGFAPTSRAETPAPKSFRLRLCSEAPGPLPGPAGAPQSRGCVATFVQKVSDPATVKRLGVGELTRRYLIYVPAHLPPGPVPLVLVFPGKLMSAEAIAFYTTHTRFESLADRDGFVVVYGNGLPDPDAGKEKMVTPHAGFLQGCLAEHAGEGVDVAYVRQIVAQVEKEVPIDHRRIYATGLSAGGGMSFQLAIEAPDLVAAIAPVVPVPYEPAGGWLLHCHARPGHERVSIAMVAATDDPFISYGPGGSREYPMAHYPGMEQARDAWLKEMGLSGPPDVDQLPDVVQGDSHQPQTHRDSSTIERQRYRPGPDGRELWFYKATGMGHNWPNPIQIWSGMWDRMGKTNQDLDFADDAWAFFQRHPGPTRIPSPPPATP